MSKDWLIRTKNNHILGPISKEKVKDLISNGSIKGDDEVCSGDGYWIYVRETELVSKYVLGDSVQGFNPVQEAKTVLAVNNEVQLEDKLPEQTDLDYPDLGDDEESKLLPEDSDLEYPSAKPKDDITMVGGIDATGLNEPEVRADDIGDSAVKMRKKKVPKKIADSSSKISEPPKLKKSPKKMQAQPKAVNKSFFSLQFIYAVVILFFVSAILAFLFRKTIFTEFMETASHSLISPVYAQDDSPKKKSGLSIRD